MPKLTRYHQLVFGGEAGANQIARFGSLSAGGAERFTGTTATPDAIQSIDPATGEPDPSVPAGADRTYLNGWNGAVLGNNSATLEDFNAISWLFTRQVAYLCERGIPEWIATCTYYIGSVVSAANGDLYRSLTDDNKGNALTDTGNWKPYEFSTGVHEVSSPYTITAEDRNQILLCDTNSGTFTINLPNPSTNSNTSFTVKDSGGTARTNNITLHRYGTETIDGVAADYKINIDYGSLNFVSNGSNWFILNKPDYVPGAILPYAGLTTPNGYLFCDGSAISRSSYSFLHSVLQKPAQNVTISIASPGVVSLTSHGYVAGSQIVFSTTGVLPTGLSAGVVYFISSDNLSSGTFRVTDTYSHAIAGTNSIATSVGQSGTHSITFYAWGAGNGTTTFNIPDLRGEFLRGLDNGRLVDTGRQLGSFQRYSTALPNSPFGITVSLCNGQSGGLSSTAQSSLGNGANFSQSVSGGGDSETRPRNIAVNYIIKY